MPAPRRYQQSLNRNQTMLLPPSVEEYVSQQNTVRAIDAYVSTLNLQDLGFTNTALFMLLSLSKLAQRNNKDGLHLKTFSIMLKKIAISVLREISCYQEKSRNKRKTKNYLFIEARQLTAIASALYSQCWITY